MFIGLPWMRLCQEAYDTLPSIQYALLSISYYTTLMTMARNRREEILLAALEVFGERGYTGASIAAVADKVGLSQQGVLHYFPSKDRLLAEVLRLRDERGLDVIALPGENGKITLDTVAAIVEYNEERRGIVQSFTVLAAESVLEGHPATDFFRERYTSSRAWMADVIRAECGSDLPGGITSEQAAPLLFAVM